MAGWHSNLLGTSKPTWRIGRATLDASGLGAARTLTVPDASGTIALTSQLSSYVAKAGDTMTGQLHQTGAFPLLGFGSPGSELGFYGGGGGWGANLVMRVYSDTAHTSQLDAVLNATTGFTVATTSIRPDGIIQAGSGASGMKVRVGDDAGLADVGIAHSTGIVSQTDSNKGRLYLGTRDTLFNDNDGWLRLNQSGQYANGVYTPGNVLLGGNLTATSYIATSSIIQSTGGNGNPALSYGSAGLNLEGGYGGGIRFKDGTTGAGIWMQNDATLRFGVRNALTGVDEKLRIGVGDINGFANLNLNGNQRNFKAYDNNLDVAVVDIGAGYSTPTDRNGYIINRNASGFLALAGRNQNCQFIIGAGADVNQLTGKLEVTREISSLGALAFLGFANREGGHDWGWYASGGIARLWHSVNGDRITVSSSGTLQAPRIEVTGRTLYQLSANSAAWIVTPRIFIQSTDPGAFASDGDLWFW